MALYEKSREALDDWRAITIESCREKIFKPFSNQIIRVSKFDKPHQ